MIGEKRKHGSPDGNIFLNKEKKAKMMIPGMKI